MNVTTTKPIVSVIVLTYNRFSNIAENIESILSQDYDDIEIIIHDDCSQDFPLERINDLLSANTTKHGYKIIRNTVNLGTVKNYNRAIQSAKGDIIIPLSQDDKFSDNNCISQIVNHFGESNCCVCTSSRIGASSGIRYPSNADINLLKYGSDERILLRIMISNFISGSVLFIRKSELIKKWNPLFDERYTLLEDYPFIFKCLCNHIHIDYIDKDIILYGENGISGAKVKTSVKLFSDELLFVNSELVPFLGNVKSRLVRKCIIFHGLKMAKGISEIKKEKDNRIKQYLFKNPDLFFLLVIMKILDRLGYDRYELIYKLEKKAK